MEVEGWASLPQPLLQEAAAYRIDDLYYYSSSYSHVTLRHPFPFLLSRSPFRAPPPLPFHSLIPFSASHHACRIFLRKIDRFLDYLLPAAFPFVSFIFASVPSFVLSFPRRLVLSRLFTFVLRFVYLFYMSSSCLFVPRPSIFVPHRRCVL